MTSTTKTLVAAQNVEAADTTKYTSPAGGKGTLIDKATLCNYTGAVVTASVNLVPSGGAVGTSNLLIDAVSIAAHATYSCPELVGKYMAPGDFLSWKASAATSISGAVNGRELST